MLTMYLCFLLGLGLQQEGSEAVSDNGATIILYEDNTWMLYKLPEGAEMVVSPIAITSDSQLVFLTDRKWKYILPSDTVGLSYDSITKPIAHYRALSDEPHLRDIPNATYSSSAAAKGQQGTVILKLLIDVNGNVMDVRVLQSSGHMELDNAAIKNGWRAKFSPPKLNGWPVRVWVSWSLNFGLMGR